MDEELKILRERLEAMERRQRRLEDELEIRELLSRYGIFADHGDHEGFVDLFTDDCEMEIHGGDRSGSYGALVEWQGKDDIRGFLADPQVHGRIEHRCMHLPGIGLRTEIDGDEAVAEADSLVIVLEDGEKLIFEAGFTRWKLRREDGRWRIRKRSRWGIGTPGFEPRLSGRS